ncbi:MAG: LysR substrate-binding domain-containing protein, partial [Planctomycetota bacterium]
ERWLAEKGRVCRVGVEFGSPEAVKHAVAEGAWLGVLSDLSIRWEVESKRLVPLKVKGFSVHRRLRVVRHWDEVAGRAVDAWASLLRETAAG